MGEMADYYNESYDIYEDYYEPWQRVCKYCNKDGFEWIETNEGWRLFDINGIHTCTKYKGK